MKNTRPLLVAIGIVALGLVGFALYLQHVKDMAPCPWCVIQRYCFVGLAIVCFVLAALPKGGGRAGTFLAALIALGGAGSAGWHVWIKAHPSVSCGIDPMETALNKIPPAELLPFLFKADGFCTTPYPPVIGLDIPVWSLIWFAFFALALLWLSFRGAPRRA
ncbi:disulfide bond formation protein B [Noviherbaspirillum galbum]|uniref:Disulfide bond formation protein B n=1 Tax=Noviherbaspirillum galbum TaxID=2709383 RepID=A0A6B3SKJ4_9BURK|nr:disulfide bond formation protein B [Noviherbaspirillum galbum]NEX61270.1 disulfide bond formation protein B [Noviherbaspirillum galbum]